jgi:tripartite-type tricarboxylate transporter receptor subunit TctC
LVIDLARNDDDKAILKLIFARQVMAWPYIAPPDVPNDRAGALRAAFSETMKDRDFLADAEKSLLEIKPVTGQDIRKLVKDVYKTPAAIARRVADILKEGHSRTGVRL